MVRHYPMDKRLTDEQRARGYLTRKAGPKMLDFSNVEVSVTDDTIKHSRKDWSTSALVGPLTTSFAEGKTVRFSVPESEEKSAHAEVRGVIEFLDEKWQQETHAEGEPFGVGKRVKTESKNGQVLFLVRAVPKSKRGPKGPTGPRQPKPAAPAAKGK